MLAISFFEVVIPSMSHVFLTDDLEFNLDTYCLQDARLICLIVLRAYALGFFKV